MNSVVKLVHTILVEKLKNALQMAVFKLQNIIKDDSLKISVTKAKVMEFERNECIRSKTVLNDKIGVQVNALIFLAFTISVNRELNTNRIVRGCYFTLTWIEIHVYFHICENIKIDRK